MKVDSSDSAFVPLDNLRALQDKIQQLKHRVGSEGIGDRMSLHARQPSGISSGAGSGAYSVEASSDLSFKDMQHNLEKIKRTGQHAQLGELHANLNMDRVQELLHPLG